MKMLKWLFADLFERDTSSQERVDELYLTNDSNREFVKSLDQRQRDYYFSLQDTWRKSLTRLESRVYELEGKL
jgi:hypothetical protein